MAQYYSTFPIGFEPAVEEFITRDMPGTQVLRTLDGAVEYKRRGVLQSFPPWLNNTFLCLTTFPRAPKEPMQDMVRLALTRGVDSETIMNHLPDGAATFRAMFMIDGQITHAGDKTMAKAEEFLAASSGLSPGRALPDVEFWFLYRKEGIGFLLMRLSYQKDMRQPLPGELRRDIAALLCRLSNPKPDDVFLDPFARYGIAKARLLYPSASVTAGDAANTAEVSMSLRGKPNAQVMRMDAVDMTAVQSGSVDAIACAPWWDEEKLDDPGMQYGKFAAEARRVLKKNGRLVLLSAMKREAEVALRLNFALDGKLEVLVAGKKAVVFTCRNT